MNIAIIPARGGSKRIPKKNIRDFAGKPMIGHVIETAMASGMFDHVVVTTDDDEIARVAEAHGALVPFRRPAELATDQATTDSVVLHAIEWLRDNGYAMDYACCIVATAAMIQPHHLCEAFALIDGTDAISTIAVTTYEYPILRAFKISDGPGYLEMMWPEYRHSRSQDLPEAYHDVGQFYWLNVPEYLANRHIFSARALPYILPRDVVVDIDTPEDWAIAERIYTLNAERRT